MKMIIFNLVNGGKVSINVNAIEYMEYNKEYNAKTVIALNSGECLYIEETLDNILETIAEMNKE